jgi:sterol desaturase/sphingolipid hydroxylase (fatty acid hydroxylase superfamily)
MNQPDLGDLQAILLVGGLLLFWGWESIRPFFAPGARVRHAVRNLTLAGVSAVASILVFAGLTAMAARFAADRGVGLLHWLDVPGWIALVVSLVLIDAWTYFWHRANHRVPLLWRFHRVHHTDEEMDVTTASRFHVGEVAISSVVRLAPVLLLGLAWQVILVYEVALVAVTQFHHANIGFDARIDRLMRYVMVTPNMHRVHHSQIRVETDSNYASILSVWDRLFRSYREKADYRAIHYGVDGMTGDAYQTIVAMLLTPFRRG